MYLIIYILYLLAFLNMTSNGFSAVAISRLYYVITISHPNTGHPGRLTRMCADIAVSIIGRICELHSENIVNVDQVIFFQIPIRNG